MSATHENTRLKTGLASAAILCAGTAMTVLAAPSMAAPGNNGTVKVAPYGDVDAIPNNQPHVGCTFQLEWYGFDAGVTSTVLFEEQAPTTGVGMTVAGDTTVDLDSGPGAGAGNDGFDGTEAYTLAFTGAPHPQQGYHVKLTIDTPESNGASVKHKVFWVEGCEPATPVTETPETQTPETQTPETQTPETQTPETQTPETQTPPVTTPVTETPTPEVLPAEASGVPSPEVNPTEESDEQPDADVLGEQAFADDSSAETEAEVLGEQAFANQSAELPTAVNAGASAAAPAESTGSSAWSMVGLMMILLGITTGGLAWARRARG